MKILLFLALQWTVLTQGNLYKLVLHSKDRGAACLDGSPAGMYIHEGSGENKNNFLLFFDGGGFCGAGSLSDTIQSCYKRSFTSLGTTVNYKPEKSFDQDGILSTIPETNQVFHDWTKIFAIYCDGSEHFGHRNDPIPYKDRYLYFRGTNNSLEQFYYLDKHYDFYNGGKIVITGISAGGMAAFQWGQYLHTHTKKAQVYLMPDSGLFLTDYYSPLAEEKVIRVRATQLLKLVTEANEQLLPEPIQKCLKEHDDDIVVCCNAANYAKFIEAPIFMIQSPYDQWSLKNNLMATCLTNSAPPFSLETCEEKQIKAIDDYRLALIQAIKQVRGGRKDVGVWGPACVQHGFSDSISYNSNEYRVPTTIGDELEDSIKMFLEYPGPESWKLEEIPWPQNRGCNGKSQKNLAVE